MQVMPSKMIKDRYGEFVEIARKQGVVHTSHGRTTLVSLSFERFEELAKAVSEIKPEYSMELEALKHKKKAKTILDFAGVGAPHSEFQSKEEVDSFIRNLRNEWD